jgi:hypothetical protein
MKNVDLKTYREEEDRYGSFIEPVKEKRQERLQESRSFMWEFTQTLTTTPVKIVGRAYLKEVFTISHTYCTP